MRTTHAYCMQHDVQKMERNLVNWTCGSINSFRAVHSYNYGKAVSEAATWKLTCCRCGSGEPEVAWASGTFCSAADIAWQPSGIPACQDSMLRLTALDTKQHRADDTCTGAHV